MARLQSNAASLADAHDYHTARLALAGLILLFRESDPDLGHGAGRGAGRILDQIALLIVDVDGLGSAVLAGRDGDAARTGLRGLTVVYGKLGLPSTTSLTKHEQSTE